MGNVSPNKNTLKKIDNAVELYKETRQEFSNLIQRVIFDFTHFCAFNSLIHSSKSRTKDPEHLRDKLTRKAIEAKKNKTSFDISTKNLFNKIDDLAGVRFLHLHTKQIESIHPLINEIIKLHGYELVSEPIANTWDIEYQKLLDSVGLKTELRESLYTSVHYTVSHYTNPEYRCEIQVRTLMEELWGEVSHTINYPHETESVSCREQLRSLARIASGCTRLVDSIFTSHEQHKQEQQKTKSHKIPKKRKKTTS